MRYAMLTGLSFGLTAAVIGNAFYQKQQFYPSVVYITKSNPSMAVMYIQALVFVLMMGKMLRALFFGQLRDAEMEHLIERSWYAVTETCLAFTVFRDDFSPRFVALFTLLLFLKCFHWLAEDRIDYMERSPTISWLFHLRALSLMFVLGLLDVLFVRHAFYSTLLKGPSVQLVFGFEYEILLTVVAMIFIKYILHTIDLQNQNPWDNKAVYLLYSELVMGLIRVVLYVAFVFIMIKVHTFPLFAIRPMYLTVRAFQKAVQDVILSRRAIRNMNTLYPDATVEELTAGDNVCIICREEMTTGCKKLPCNHIFHTSCLRSWFQRQQTCPTCRLEVLRMPRAQQQNQRNQQQQNQEQNQQQNQQNQQPQPPQPPVPGAFGGFPFQWPPQGQGMPAPPYMWPPQQQQQQQQAAAAPQTSQATSTQSAAAPTSSSTPSTDGAPSSASPLPPLPGGLPFLPPFMPPPPMMPSFGFPPPPVSMAGLSEEELRAMEGVERGNIEARIQWLKDIQALLDGAMMLIGQYNTVASHMGSQGINLTSAAVPPPATYLSPSEAAASTSASSQEGQRPSEATWWPADGQGAMGQGARPKYSTPVMDTHTTDTQARARSTSVSDKSEKEAAAKSPSAEGATATEQSIPQWEDPRQEEHGDEMHEVRKRRLQHFSSQTGGNDSYSTDTQGAAVAAVPSDSSSSSSSVSLSTPSSSSSQSKSSLPVSKPDTSTGN